METWDLLLTDVHVATMRDGALDYGRINNAAVAVSGGKVAWIGAAEELPSYHVSQTQSLGNRWITPALIDCHTHLLFAGDRSLEYEQRLQGVSYESIAAAGGGIATTVQATRDADDDSLYSLGLERVKQLAASGVATIEIKSGYGLDIRNEIRLLEVARKLGRDSGICIQTSLLAAHAVPPEYKDDANSYIELICDELLPAVAEQGLADAVDAYCEKIAFDATQVEKVFQSAQSFGLPVKLHADQLSDCGGAQLAAGFGALSADHLEYSSQQGIRAMADSGTVAVLLPGAYLTLNETQQPPVDDLRSFGVPVALATDLNPGTSALLSVPAAMALASRLFGLTPEECLAGATREAARALGLADDRGTIEVGKRADIAVWDITDPRELSYWMGSNPLSQLLVSGRRFSP